MYCTECGSLLPDSANFCNACGTQVGQHTIHKPAIDPINLAHGGNDNGSGSMSSQPVSDGVATGFLIFAAFALYSISQIVAAYVGISHGIGTIWAIVAFGAAFFFRFTLPLTFGAFYGAMYVWGWPWYGALPFAAPGLLFIIPGMIASALASLKGNQSA